ncbi:LysR family transcriptional regulator [Vibrio panuliri]|uniref:LysR family transcriptional regulator n=1 Tax=Vibrio panuliri TaxID=1381081 RepID=A0A1Q9HEN5_9VIBR|nr:LysR family transcriptional regulator [Vibrio panuliri]KAB1455517.1 LysR family transcriptional regulator [Vibrio panuliri]OLQ88168.1 LysR family transcriptional regulator [Vibrio panuliri]OLQ94137.1 LysR family transcriptional regulator [Vibrio panuliri]
MKAYPNLPFSHNSLKVFESVARLLSFTQAAQELNVTQSAVSRQIKALEQELNATLIIRKHRAIELSDKGIALFEVLRSNYLELQTLLEKWSQPEKKRLVIKSAISFATRILIPRVRELNERYPDYEIVIIPLLEGDWDLSREQSDLAIINTRQPELYRGHPKATFLRDEYMAPVYASGEGLSVLSLQEMLAMPRLHATDDHLDWRYWLSQEEDRGVRPSRDTSFVSLDLAISACLAGHGATVTDLLLVLPELERGFLCTPDCTPVRSSAWQYFAYLPQKSDIANDLLAWLQGVFASDLARLNALATKHQWHLG